MFILDSTASGLLVVRSTTLNFFQNKKLENNIIRDDCERIAFEHTSEITASTFLPSRGFLAFTDVLKKFHLLDTRNANQSVTTKSIQKRAMKIIFNHDEDLILIGDKTGDVYLLDLKLNDLANQEFKLIMGHLSMLTDLALSFDAKYLFTSDRDEKIRISHFPNAYNIQSFLLGHKEFVVQIQQIDPNRLVSVSGDSKLILWNLADARQIQEIATLDLIKDESRKKNLKGIDKFDYHAERNLLLVHLFRSDFLMQFSYDEKKLFQFVSLIDLGHGINDFVRLNNNDSYLFLSLEQSSSPIFLFKKIHDGKVLDLDEKESTGLPSVLNESIRIDDRKKLNDEYENNYWSYFKTAVNNMEEYFERKKERIEATSNKRKRLDTKSDSNLSLSQ